jgi:hypothetical protein
LADCIADLSALFKASPGDVWAFFHATAETSHVSPDLPRNLPEAASAWSDAKDPRAAGTAGGVANASEER